ncbi:transposase [Streptomyces sp. NPDC002553]|uniref:transposase n=1 Tax=Streptomyces sp. NPDC002553 TaxID=3154417 RepID=UPI0033293721
MRVNHTYGRGGALAYLAAYDVHQAKVFGRCEPTTGIGPFMNLVTQVMSREPYASAKRVFWIVDNGSSHRGKAATARLTTGFSNAVLVHTPVRASWLNQVEVYFSAVQRKALSPNDFTDLCQFPVKVHHLRPGRSAGQARPTRRRSPRRMLAPTRRMINPRRTYDEDYSDRSRRARSLPLGHSVDAGRTDRCQLRSRRSAGVSACQRVRGFRRGFAWLERRHGGGHGR